MFGIGPIEMLIIVAVGGFFLALATIVIAAAIKILGSPKPPHDPRL